jgi:exoribonuclease-2
MFVLFEEEGSFKAGTVLTDNDSSLQVENTRGKRVKLKRANVLLEFREPSPADLLTRAQIAADEFDTDFLWSACGDEEFAFGVWP